VTDANGNSVTSDGAKLIVGESCKITSQPTDQTVAVGERAVFTVVASGTDLTYQWQISVDGGTTWKSFANTTDTFSITAKAAYNGYMYRCIVTDANGNSVTSDGAKLIVIIASSDATNETDESFNDVSDTSSGSSENANQNDESTDVVLPNEDNNDSEIQ
ncbi:MAG: hypothetical protein ACI31Q_01855, partial [Erysipelotrichaceae bacterium]